MTAASRTRASFRFTRFVQPITAIVAAIMLLGIPFWLIIITAGKNRGEALVPTMALPTEWHLWENSQQYSPMVACSPRWGSLLVMVPSVLGVLILGSMAAWILGRRASRSLAFLYALAISGIVLPPAVVTVVLLLRQIGLAGTAVGMIGVYMGMTFRP